jgi:hypothetical protein
MSGTASSALPHRRTAAFVPSRGQWRPQQSTVWRTQRLSSGQSLSCAQDLPQHREPQWSTTRSSVGLHAGGSSLGTTSAIAEPATTRPTTQSAAGTDLEVRIRPLPKLAFDFAVPIGSVVLLGRHGGRAGFIVPRHRRAKSCSRPSRADGDPLASTQAKEIPGTKSRRHDCVHTPAPTATRAVVAAGSGRLAVGRRAAPAAGRRGKGRGGARPCGQGGCAGARR